MHRSLAMLPRLLFILLVLSAALAQTPAPLSAQVPTEFVVSDTLHEVRLIDGSTLIGRIVATAGERITLETTAGIRVQLTRDQIRAIRPVQGRVVAGEIQENDPNTTRLFFGPTGRSLPSGGGYFGVFELFFPYVSYGVTDRFLIAAGTPIIPEVIGRVFYLAPKFQLVDAGRVQASAGVLALFGTGDDFDFGTGGILYGVGTFGDQDNAVTAGAGWFFAASSEDADLSNRPLLMLGGERRIGARTKLLTENYLFTYKDECVSFEPSSGQCRSGTEAVGLLSAGIRFFGERLSADAGVGIGVGGGEFGCCVPLGNFVYNFGGRRR